MAEGAEAGRGVGKWLGFVSLPGLAKTRNCKGE